MTAPALTERSDLLRRVRAAFEIVVPEDLTNEELRLITLLIEHAALRMHPVDPIGNLVQFGGRQRLR